jgi:hypothetical protein
MLEFTVEGVDYRAGKLNAFQQLHVSRKLAGILPKVFPALLAASGGATDLAALASACEPAAEALAAMPEADVDFVYHTCLGVVARKQGPAWANVWNGSAKALMFDDITLAVMSQLAYRVLEDSLGSFIRGLLARATAASPETPAA